MKRDSLVTDTRLAKVLSSCVFFVSAIMVDSVSNDDLGHLLRCQNIYNSRIIKHSSALVQSIHFITYLELEPPLFIFSFCSVLGNHIAIDFNKQRWLQIVANKPDLDLDHFSCLAICGQCFNFSPGPSLKFAIGVNLQGVDIISCTQILPPDSFIFTQYSRIGRGGYQ